METFQPWHEAALLESNFQITNTKAKKKVPMKINTGEFNIIEEYSFHCLLQQHSGSLSQLIFTWVRKLLIQTHFYAIVNEMLK